jgi:hypothetical protein
LRSVPAAGFEELAEGFFHCRKSNEMVTFELFRLSLDVAAACLVFAATRK